MLPVLPPDLRPLVSASRAVGQIIGKGDVVIYESTVYPGATEDDCIPVIEEVSGLAFNQDFFAGYSPERINPGDKEHRVTTIKKVTSGSTPEIADFVDELYASIITAGTHKASSIAVAEAAGIPRTRIIADPGIGFGKTFRHNLQLLHHLQALQALNCPILVGASRKAFIRHLLKPPGEKDIRADLPIVATGIQATVAASALQGAHIVRVHEVAETRATLKIIDAIRTAGAEPSGDAQGAG